MFDCLKRTRGWKEDPNLSLNDNLFFGAVHFTQVFFGKYRVNRTGNEHDYDDMAADCSIAVYEAAKRNMDKWDQEKHRLDQYLYGRAWSVVGQWLKTYFDRKRRSPIEEPKLSENTLTPVEYDVGTDEIASNIQGSGTRYTVFRETPRSYFEKQLSDAAEQYIDYYEECVDLGIDPVAPEDFLTNKSSLETDLRYLEKILNKENPNTRVAKKRVRASLGKVKHST
jgi:hypothetical protein